MKAVRLNRPASIESSPLQVIELPRPKPREEEVLLRVNACGVCHTDLHLAEGELPPHRLPLILGHQIVGTVEEVGKKVKGIKTGDLVGVPWLNRVCGQCKFCQKGKENLCLEAQFTGYDVDGGYAEFTSIHQQAVYHLPSGYQPEELAPLLCGGVIGYRSYRLTSVKKGDTLALYGFGSSAHLVLQMALFEGIEVFVFTRSLEHQQLARNLGASFVGKAGDVPPHPVDGTIIFAPAGNLVKDALNIMDPGGKVVTAGIYSTPIPQIPYELIYQERAIQSTANSTQRDIRELLELAGQVRLQPQIEVFPLEMANQVLQKLKRSEIKASAVLKPK